MKHFFSKNSLQQSVATVLVFASILSFANLSPATTVAQTPGNSENVASLKQSRTTQLPRSVSNAVRRDLSRRTGIPRGQLQVATFSQESWSDSCLGLGRLNELCAQVFIENGWRVVMSDGRQNWVYRTDSTGRTLRLEGQETPGSSLPNAVTNAVLRAASRLTGRQTSELRLVKAEQVVTDGCLSLPRPREACTKIALTAWEVTIEAGQQRLVYRATDDGSQVRLNEGASQLNRANLPKAVANAVLQLASQHFNLPTSQLRIAGAEQQTWSDGCLGLPSPVERCMGVLTPGWRVTVEGGAQQIYRTDDSGSRIRTEAIAGLAPRTDRLPNSVAYAILRDVRSRGLSLPDAQLQILQAEQQTWSNGCLGMARPRQFCTQALIPGWRVTVDGSEQSLVYRTNASGSLIKLEELPGQASRQR